jgi:hypothetical protein
MRLRDQCDFEPLHIRISTLSKIRAGTACAIQRFLGVKPAMTDRSAATNMYLWRLGLNAFVGSHDP